MDLGLTGRTALVSGASQGIGEGIAKILAAEGCNLHLTARNADNLRQVKADIVRDRPVQVTVHPTDLAAAEAPARLADAVGDVDILINNAGVIPGGDLQFVDEKTWRQGWELKVFGYINVSRLFYARMKRRGRGVIINIIGNAGECFDASYIAGTSGNASLMAFTRALGGRSLDDGIRVVGINPGPVDTERIYALLRKRSRDIFGTEDRWPELQARYPLGRPAKVSEIADLVAFLASDRSGYTSGTVFTVDGGISSRSSII